MPELFKREELGEAFPAPPPPPPAPPAPAAPAEEKEPLTLIREDIEEIAEAIIAEKWKKFSEEIAQLKEEVEKLKADIDRIASSASKLEERMSNLERAIFAKVEEYGRGISDVGVELKAMQRVFKTILPEFTANIKELRALVERAKRKK